MRNRSVLYLSLSSVIKVMVVLLLSTPLPANAQGNEFFSCKDIEGGITITNRHYDSERYQCVPFTTLNREFKEVESIQKKQGPAEDRAVWPTEREVSAAAQAARLSAESARVAMEAAHAAAHAAEITSQAVRAALQPEVIVIYPQSSIYPFDRRFVWPNRPGLWR